MTDGSFIQAISIAPLQVHYYSEALPTHHGYCVEASCRRATGNCAWRTSQVPYVAARAGLEPMTFRSTVHALIPSHSRTQILPMQWEGRILCKLNKTNLHVPCFCLFKFCHQSFIDWGSAKSIYLFDPLWEFTFPPKLPWERGEQDSWP